MILSPAEVAMLAVNGFGAMQKPGEFCPFLELVDSRGPRVILEIGVGKAGSTWAYSKIQSAGKIICVDLPGGPWGGGPDEASLQYIANNSRAEIHFVAGNSSNKEALEAVERYLDGAKVDFLIIDGDHSYAGVKSDFMIYAPMVRSGGLIAFHDICDHAPETGCEVSKFWEEIKASGIPPEKFSEFLTEPLNWGGIGVIEWPGFPN